MLLAKTPSISMAIVLRVGILEDMKLFASEKSSFDIFDHSFFIWRSDDNLICTKEP